MLISIPLDQLPRVFCTGYYSYKFAEVLSADAFSAFEEAGLDDDSKVQETGHRFRDTVLALGGGRAPDLVFKVSSCSMHRCITRMRSKRGGASEITSEKLSQRPTVLSRNM